MEYLEYYIYVKNTNVYEKKHKSKDLLNIIPKIYQLLNSIKSENIYVGINYFDIEICKFYVRIKDGLFLYNNLNTIKVGSILPFFAPLDNFLHNNNVTKNNIKKNPMMQIKDNKIKKINKQDKETQDRELNDELKVFEADKQAYFKMKKDIADGLLAVNIINPNFIKKYYIFSLLDLRKDITIDNMIDIDTEYTKFKMLYNDDSESDEETKGLYGGLFEDFCSHLISE